MTRLRSPPEFYREPKSRRNETCRKISYRDGKATECGAASNGKVYCPKCAHTLLTLTDRVPETTRQPDSYSWAQVELFPRKRA